MGPDPHGIFKFHDTGEKIVKLFVCFSGSPTHAICQTKTVGPNLNLAEGLWRFPIPRSVIIREYMHRCNKTLRKGTAKRSIS